MAVFAGPSQRSRGPVALDLAPSLTPTATTIAITSNREFAGFNRTVIKFTNYSMTIADTGTVGTSQILDMPEGVILFAAAAGSLTFTTTSTLASTLNASVACVWAVGTATSTAGDALTSTEADIIPSTAWTSSATINTANTATVGVLAAPLSKNGASTPVDVWLNLGVVTNTDIDGDATVLVNGTIVLIWANVGDF